MSVDLKPGKTCRTCNKGIGTHYLWTDFTCRTCQHECPRIEPLFRAFVDILTEVKREHSFALKQVRDELTELKASLSGRQQKASTSVKALKDDITGVKDEMEALRKCLDNASAQTQSPKVKVAGENEKQKDKEEWSKIEEKLNAKLKELNTEVKEVKAKVVGVEQDVSSLYQAQDFTVKEEEAEWRAERAEARETLDGLEDFTKRLKSAFVALAGPEEKVVQKQKEQEEKDRQELKQGLAELQGFMSGIQKAFATIPVQKQAPSPLASQ